MRPPSRPSRAAATAHPPSGRPRRRRARLPAWASIAALVALATGAALLAQSESPPRWTVPLLRLATPAPPPAPVTGAATVSGPLRAPGGPFLFDAKGRVVLLRGVNVVYKHPPYEVYPDPGKPWNFGAADASLIARLGFDVVRLGITWKGLEPGTAPANTPAICTPGPPRDPHQLTMAVLTRYLRRLRRTVDLLGRYHIYSLLDMHQDVYSEMFDGEGAPNWAVCTDGVASKDPPGRWSRNYGTAAAGIAYDHFWDNNVVGDLQGQFDTVWGLVARYFANDPWIVGYDPFNEPFSASLVRLGDEHFDAQLECFYTGTAHKGRLGRGARPLVCPPGVPADGVLPTILANDPRHLLFIEPDNYASRGFPTFLGPMPFGHLVFNFHVYCGARSPRSGNPTDVAACIAQGTRSLARKSEDRLEMASAAQPGGPAWFMSEFGATSNPTLLAAVTTQADQLSLGWSYWSWQYYADPTGSAAESLVMATGRVRATAAVLARPYPQALAGTPTTMTFDPISGRFDLTYTAAPQVRAPTVVMIPTAVHYPAGYCATVSGGVVLSGRGSQRLVVRNDPGVQTVQIALTSGPCPRG